MCDASLLLADVVRCEEAGLLHAEQCSVCNQSSQTQCAEAMELAMASIAALLGAKVYIDSRERQRSSQSMS